MARYGRNGVEISRIEQVSREVGARSTRVICEFVPGLMTSDRHRKYINAVAEVVTPPIDNSFTELIAFLVQRARLEECIVETPDTRQPLSSWLEDRFLDWNSPHHDQPTAKSVKANKKRPRLESEPRPSLSFPGKSRFPSYIFK